MNLACQVTRYGLLALVVVSLAVWGRRTFSPAPMAGGGAVLPADGIVVVNFHAAIRCNGCREIDRETQAVLKSDFSAALESGRMGHAVINFEVPANQHFIQDYGLTTSTVVLVRRKEGQDIAWDRLDAVWNHLYDGPAMREYLKERISRITVP